MFTVGILFSYCYCFQTIPKISQIIFPNYWKYSPIALVTSQLPPPLPLLNSTEVFDPSHLTARSANEVQSLIGALFTFNVHHLLSLPSLINFSA